MQRNSFLLVMYHVYIQSTMGEIHIVEKSKVDMNPLLMKKLTAIIGYKMEQGIGVVLVQYDIYPLKQVKKRNTDFLASRRILDWKNLEEFSL